MENKQQLNVNMSELNPDDKYKVMYINGKRIQIKRGEDVMVSPIIKDIYNESERNKRKGNIQDKPLELS